MKKLMMFALAMVALCACHGKSGSAVAIDAATTDVQTASDQEVVQRVNDIYDAVFKIYNEEDSLRNLDVHIEDGVYAHRGDFVRNYCSKDWNTLVNRINEIDSLYNSDELGFWEADYWIMGQDWHELSVSDVKVVSMTERDAVVELQLHNFDSTTPVRLSMVNENGTWCIDRFVDVRNDHDWKQEMEEYVAEYKE